MSAGVDLGLYRNFVSDYKGQYAVTDENKNEQARFTEGMGGKTALTGYDVSGTGSALGRGLERIGRAIGSAFRLLGRLITFGHVQPPHKNYEVRMAFKDAILAHLRQNSSYGDMKTGLEGKLPPEILDKFKGELNSNKPLTKRRIKIVLEAVDEYVATNPKPQVEPKKADALPKEEAQSKTEKTEVKEEKPTRSADVVKQEIKELEERVGKLRAQIQNYDNVSPDDPKTDWSQVKDVRLQLIGQDYSAAKDQLNALKEELKQVEAKPIDEQPKQEVKEEPKEKVEEEPKKEEVKEEPKEEVKEQPKEEVKEEPKKEVVKEELKEQPKEVKEQPKEEVKQVEAKQIDEQPKVEEKKPEVKRPQVDLNKLKDQMSKTPAKDAPALVKTYLPKLEDRINQLRTNTLKWLGIDRDLEKWAGNVMPGIDMKSDSFGLDVKAAFRGQAYTGQKSETLEDIEDAIVKKCETRDTFQYADSEGNSGPVAFLIGDMVDNDQPLTLDRYNQVLEDYQTSTKTMPTEGVSFGTPILTILSRAPKMNEVNQAFKAFLKDVGQVNVRQIVSDALKSETYRGNLSSDGVDEICKLLNDTVIGELKKAENIWDIQPTSFSNHLIDLIFRPGKPDIKTCVTDIIKGLLGDLVPKKDDPKIGRIHLDFDKRISFEDAKRWDAKTLIDTAIRRNTGIPQVGGSNCFMVSIVNALLGVKNGQKLLQGCFGQKDSYTFYSRLGGKFTISQEEVDKTLNDYENANKDCMSQLERAIWAAYFIDTDNCSMPRPLKNVPGNQCEADAFSFLFGFGEMSSKATENHGAKLPESLLGKLADTHNCLARGQIAIVHTGGTESGHYRALTDVTPGTIKSGKLTCFESLENLPHKVSLEGKDLYSNGKGEGTKIITFTLPKV